MPSTGYWSCGQGGDGGGAQSRRGHAGR